MIHRAVLGSVERMTAILTESYGGKWPFWLSPRQCKIITVHESVRDYANDVKKQIFEAGFEIEYEENCGDTMNKQVHLTPFLRYFNIKILGPKGPACPVQLHSRHWSQRKRERNSKCAHQGQRSSRRGRTRQAYLKVQKIC